MAFRVAYLHLTMVYSKGQRCIAIYFDLLVCLRSECLPTQDQILQRGYIDRGLYI